MLYSSQVYDMATPTRLDKMFDQQVHISEESNSSGSSHNSPMIMANHTNCTNSFPGISRHMMRMTTPPHGQTTQAVPEAVPVSPCNSVDSTTSMDEDPQESEKFSRLEQKYHVDPRVLGTGHHGSVRECINRTTGQRFAVKSVKKTDPSVKPGCLLREIMLLDEMKHANIISLVDVFEDEEYLHIVTTLCEGGELFDRIVEKAATPEGSFSESSAARILYQILSAVSYMHSHNIVHRDIKPENILFETQEEDSAVKLIDFGLARKHYANKGEPPMKTIVGTPYYISPDVLSKSYGKACDLWSVGVIAYVLLCGYPPFNGNNNKDIYKMIRKAQLCFPSQEWGGVSEAAKDFVTKLLEKDAGRRMGVDEALRHPWIVKHANQVNRTSFNSFNAFNALYPLNSFGGSSNKVSSEITSRPVKPSQPIQVSPVKPKKDATMRGVEEAREDTSVEVVFEESSRKDAIYMVGMFKHCELQ